MANLWNLILWISGLCFVASTINVLMIENSMREFQAKTRNAKFQNSGSSFHHKSMLRNDKGHQAIENETYKIDAMLLPHMLEMVKERNISMKLYKNYYKPIEQKVPKQTRGIIIVTQYRSGSSFLGELFNQHNDAFYTFEPLTMFLNPEGDNTHAEDKVDVLRRILNCDFPDIVSLYKTYDFRNHKLNKQCIKDNLCFRERIRNLCSMELCPRRGACQACHGPFHLPRVNQMCRSKKISAIKVIRLYNINWLKSILEDPSYDLKIIHLVRDPRGIQNSRLQLHPKMNVSVNTATMCHQHLTNGIHTLSNDTDWLSGKYFRIRYEDLARYPFKYSSEIYRFVGISFPTNIENWIAKNTKAKVHTNSQWATSRNSSKTMESWRQQLSFDKVTLIQKICGEVMDMYGYKPVGSVEELRDLSIQLTDRPT